MNFQKHFTELNNLYQRGTTRFYKCRLCITGVLVPMVYI